MRDRTTIEKIRELVDQLEETPEEECNSMIDCDITDVLQARLDGARALLDSTERRLAKFDDSQPYPIERLIVLVGDAKFAAGSIFALHSDAASTERLRAGAITDAAVKIMSAWLDRQEEER